MRALNRAVNMAKLLAICGVCILGACTPKVYKLTTVSPNGSHTVRFEERSKSSNHIWYAHDIYFSLDRMGQPIIQNSLFFQGKEWDKRFIAKYPDQSWVSNNILRLGSKNRLPQAQCDEVLVYNETANIATYLRFNGAAYEEFLLFDLEPHSSEKVYAQPQTDEMADTSWIGSEGQFDNGSKISGDGDFWIHELYKGPAHYRLTIKDDKIIITSQEFKPPKDDE